MSPFCILSLLFFSPRVFSHPKRAHILPRESNLNPYPDKRLTFKQDGTFKLTVFSDLHFGENPWEAWGPQHDAASVQLFHDILGTESPDFAVINGDLITGENQIFGPFKARNIPFATTHGNHDNSATITHLAEIQQIQQKFPFSYTRTGPSGVGGFGGEGNYWVPIYAKADDQKPALVIWFFDSRGGKPPSSDPSVTMADWVDPSVADWITSESAAMEQTWGSSDQRGALVFVHIPPNAIQAVQGNVNAQKNPGMNEDGLGAGSVQNINDGPFWDALTSKIPNLHAIISGHGMFEFITISLKVAFIFPRSRK
ncbi:Metallo-dependent phosphatase-like protein [Crepidotus variabilis]|uniref:Metallo-dependent phosphatase-like protein n=1 Tax=Crepidotus variabilis TaxID=179855 RepID=A0A9P6EAC2_9AGAR|nr:Metallo-dependent phosphatase-like protein [Crepidotus variabilis]